MTVLSLLEIHWVNLLDIKDSKMVHYLALLMVIVLVYSSWEINLVFVMVHSLLEMH